MFICTLMFCNILMSLLRPSPPVVVLSGCPNVCRLLIPTSRSLTRAPLLKSHLSAGLYRLCPALYRLYSPSPHARVDDRDIKTYVKASLGLETTFADLSYTTTVVLIVYHVPVHSFYPTGRRRCLIKSFGPRHDYLCYNPTCL